MRHAIVLFLLTLVACGSADEPPVTAKPEQPQSAKLEPNTVIPGTYLLTMTLCGQFPVQTCDRNGNCTGCPATREAEVNVSKVDGVPDVTYASDPNVHLETEYQDHTVQYRERATYVTEWCDHANLPVNFDTTVTWDTRLQDPGIATLVIEHACTPAETCDYIVTGERL